MATTRWEDCSADCMMRGKFSHPFRIGELLQDGFKSRIRLTNALGILNDSFPVSEQTRYGKSHRNAMIAETCYACPMQRSRAMNFETIVHLRDLRAHSAQIMRDSGNTIGFFHTQFLGMPNNRLTICQGARHCEDRQFVNELRHFSALNNGAFYRDPRDLDDSARIKLIDLVNCLAHLRTH